MPAVACAAVTLAGALRKAFNALGKSLASALRAISAAFCWGIWRKSMTAPAALPSKGATTRPPASNGAPSNTILSGWVMISEP